MREQGGANPMEAIRTPRKIHLGHYLAGTVGASVGCWHSSARDNLSSHYDGLNELAVGNGIGEADMRGQLKTQEQSQLALKRVRR